MELDGRMMMATTAAARPGRARKGATVTMGQFAEEMLHVYLDGKSRGTMVSKVRRIFDIFKELGLRTTAELDGEAIRRFHAAFLPI